MTLFPALHQRDLCPPSAQTQPHKQRHLEPPNMPPQHNNPLQNTSEPSIQTQTHSGRLEQNLLTVGVGKCGRESCLTTNTENTVLSRLCYGTQSVDLGCWSDTFRERLWRKINIHLLPHNREGGGGKRREANPSLERRGEEMSEWCREKASKSNVNL